VTLIELPALRADSALGFLAALGALRLVVEELGDDTATVSWPDGPYSAAVLATERIDSVESFAAAINEVVASMRSNKQLLPTVTGFPPSGEGGSVDPTSNYSAEDGRGLASSARDDERLSRWISATVALSPTIDRKTRLPGNLEKNRFLKAGPGTVWVPRTLAGLLKSMTSTSVIEAFLGWRRTDDFIGGYFENRADIEAATGQAARAPKKRGVPGATFLAFMALPLVPVRTPGLFATETVGWSQSPKVPKGFCWPVWADQLGLAAIRGLLDHPAIAMFVRTGSASRLEGLGVSAVFRSVRIAAGNNDAALAPATLIWPVGE
jgi:hypothetical protein